MKKKVLSALLIAAMTASMVAGCGSASDDSSSNDGNKNNSESDAKEGDTAEDPVKNLIAATDGTVKLDLWCSEQENWQTVMKSLIDEFQKEYSDVTFDITIGSVSESDAKDRILEDVEAAADVFVFANDQVSDLVAADALQSVDTTYTYDVASENDENAVEAASADGTLYGYPLVASNGFFLYYDKNVFSESDVASWESLLAKANEEGVKVGMDIANGWYLYGFFAGAGLDVSLNEDKTNSCNWNATDTTPTGVQVAEAIQTIAADDAFIAVGDEDSRAMYKDKLKAYVDGTWAVDDIIDAYGEDYGAAKLPTFKAGDTDVQMGSFNGYKLVGVNKTSENLGWSMLLAEYISNKDSQAKIAEATGEGASNTEVAATQDSAALKALAEQNDFADPQRIGDKFWDPAASLGASLVEGGVSDMQKLLDETVAGITQAVE